MDCDEIFRDFTQCLNENGGRAKKCTEQMEKLKGCNSKDGRDYCVKQTVELLECAKGYSGFGRGGSRHCADSFIKMRECSRAQGIEVFPSGEGFVVTTDSTAMYNATEMEMPPKSTYGLDRLNEAVRFSGNSSVFRWGGISKYLW